MHFYKSAIRIGFFLENILFAKRRTISFSWAALSVLVDNNVLNISKGACWRYPLYCHSTLF